MKTRLFVSFILLGCWVLATGCEKARLPEEKMAAILWDMQQENDAFFSVPNYHQLDSTQRALLGHVAGEAILKKHDVSRESFVYSIEAYQKDALALSHLSTKIRHLAEAQKSGKNKRQKP